MLHDRGETFCPYNPKRERQEDKEKMRERIILRMSLNKSVHLPYHDNTDQLLATNPFCEDILDYSIEVIWWIFKKKKKREKR